MEKEDCLDGGLQTRHEHVVSANVREFVPKQGFDLAGGQAGEQPGRDQEDRTPPARYCGDGHVGGLAQGRGNGEPALVGEGA
jgi:hypothetical protein